MDHVPLIFNYCFDKIKISSMLSFRELKVCIYYTLGSLLSIITDYFMLDILLYVMISSPQKK